MDEEEEVEIIKEEREGEISGESVTATLCARHWRFWPSRPLNRAFYLYFPYNPPWE